MNWIEDTRVEPSPGDEIAAESPLDVGPLGARAVEDRSFSRALAGFRSRLAAFGLGSLPSPILAPAPCAGQAGPGVDQPEDL
ncbi:MAG: hypothetical protein ACREMH_09395 [Gemmatimonadales bacterium]